MDAEAQAGIKRIVESQDSKDNFIVVLGASDLDGAEISAETVTLGDPSFAGPLAGVSLGLPVYHILEPDVRKCIPEDVYNESVGIMTMVVDPQEVGERFKTIREKVAKSNP
jgi:betaine reductase